MENNHSSSRKEKKEKKHKKEKKDKKDKKDKRTAVDSVLTMLGEGTGQKAITSAITEKVFLSINHFQILFHFPNFSFGNLFFYKKRIHLCRIFFFRFSKKI